jgi:hypothetical protein
MKRDLLSEINEIKGRSEYNSRYEISIRLDEIEKSLSMNSSHDKELFKYIPIAVVACFEAFFRSIFKELVDFGKPYSDNVIKFNQSKNIKLDFDIINAIQAKSVTVGEFISHILPLNNLDDINQNLSALMGLDFLQSLKTFKKNSVFESITKPCESFTENSNQIIGDIKRAFDLRHIFCHEFAANIIIDTEVTLRLLVNSKIFIAQTSNFVHNLLYPNAPETQSAMNEEADKKYLTTEKELIDLISKIKEATKEIQYNVLEDSLFDRTISAWKEYRKVKAEIDGSYFKGGTIEPLIYCNSLITTTEEKIESLKKEYNFDLKKFTRHSTLR